MSKRNENIAVIDANYGTSNASNIVHAFSPDYDFVVRTNGGSHFNNILTTNDKQYEHKLIPSIDFSHKHVRGFLGAGMVINLQTLINELITLEKDFPGVSNRIYVDPDAFVVFKQGHVSTTEQSEAISYNDKMFGRGTKISSFIKSKSLTISTLEELGVNFIYAAEMKQKLVSNKILFEGSSGVLLDVNHGTHPYVRAYDCSTSSISTSGFGFVMPSKVYGVISTYSSRIGEGPFPTEIRKSEAENLKNFENEQVPIGKRFGWLDLPATKYAIDKASITSLIITKFNINGFKTIPICHKYDGKFPMSGSDFISSKIRLLEMNSWENPKDFQQIKEFIDCVQYYTETKVSFISCGKNREDMLGL